MQYPDSSDCGLQKVPCFTFGDLPSGSTEDASKFDEANSWGKCENGMQSEGIGGTCAAYPLRQTYEEGKAINVPVGSCVVAANKPCNRSTRDTWV